MEEKQIGDLIEELKALKLRESVVISQLEAANRRRSTHDTTATAEQEIGLSPGDRVYVVNRVRKPATDNGVRTWRAPNNLRKLTK